MNSFLPAHRERLDQQHGLYQRGSGPGCRLRRRRRRDPVHRRPHLRRLGQSARPASAYFPRARARRFTDWLALMPDFDNFPPRGEAARLYREKVAKGLL